MEYLRYPSRCCWFHEYFAIEVRTVGVFLLLFNWLVFPNGSCRDQVGKARISEKRVIHLMPHNNTMTSRTPRLILPITPTPTTRIIRIPTPRSPTIQFNPIAPTGDTISFTSTRTTTWIIRKTTRTTRTWRITSTRKTRPNRRRRARRLVIVILVVGNCRWRESRC